jgi:mannose-6-phosphate isomerase-like protein (cupin superfamily)
MKRSTILAGSLACLVLGLAAGIAIARSRSARASEEKAAPAGSGVVVLEAAKVAGAFMKGQMLLTTGEYKVMAGHRVEPGVPEVHAGDTDVFYILDGEATFVTGGKVVDPRLESAGETRGSRIEGGEARTLRKGEVIVIPRGIPHWFSAVPHLVDYFVVKVTGQPFRP